MHHIVLGAFYGDEGKGQCVNNLCQREKDKGNSVCVIRFSGGHQVGHNVKHNDLQHCFSNYGSGTLQGVPTYWSGYCTVDPMTSMLEFKALEKIGCTPTIYYAPTCQIVLPFDVWGQWGDTENLKHGSVGTGYKKCLDRGKAGYGITVLETMNINVLREKIRGIMNGYYKMKEDTKFPMAFDIDKWCTLVYSYFWKLPQVKVQKAIPKADSYIFEGSQGIMLDQDYGVMPYCTPSYTTSRNVWPILRTQGIVGEIKVHLMCRPYITRHGNGPFCSSKNVFEICDKNNPFNYYQGSIRACVFDPELLQYSYTVNNQFTGQVPTDIIFSNGELLEENGKDAVIDSILSRIPIQKEDIHAFEYEKWLY